MQVAQFIVAVLAGYRLVAALYRWDATVRVLGVRRTLAGAALTWRIRTQRPFRSGSAHEVRLWPIHPTVPVLFELQAIALALLLLYWFKDLSAVAQIVRDPIMIYAAIWAVARASEGVLPPCLLYLGVSEPGQFESFRYLASSRSWLAVSAIDQENPDVNRGDAAGGPVVGMAAGLLASVLRPIPGLRLLVLLPFQRRRLESVRTGDDLWESSIRSLITFVPLIVADLRSHSAIVSNELVWVLQMRASERLVAITRRDGSTILTPLLHRLGIDPRSIAWRTPDDDALNAVVAESLDTRNGAIAVETATTDAAAATASRLAAEIANEADQKRALLPMLETATEASGAVDAMIQAWAHGTPLPESAPAYTSSLYAAVALVRRRIDKSSYSLHIGADHRAWADLGAQPIAGSFRVSVSSMEKPVDSAAKALIMVLLKAELGIAWGRPMQPRATLRRLSPGADQYAQWASEELARLFPFLRDAQTSPGWHEPAGEQSLAAFFHIPRDTLVRDDEEARTDELQHVIDAVQGRGRYTPREGPYSLSIDVGIEGAGRAEVARMMKNSGRWLIARSSAPGADVWLRPGVALMIAALKAEFEAFDGMSPRQQ